MPKRVKPRFRDVAIGVGIATIFFGGALATDLAGLQTRVISGELSWRSGLIGYLATASLFALVQIWLSRHDGSDQPKPPRGGRRREAVPVRVTVPVRNKRR